MKHIETLYAKGDHRWAVIARDSSRGNHLIDTNEYLVSKGDRTLIADPGGAEIFPAVFSAISREYDPSRIDTIFASHQDPDIVSSLGLWLDFQPDIRCYVSRLWTTFIPHFGGNEETFISLPDEGMAIDLNGLSLKAIPAHYLHSSGNFHLYDPEARILFTSDVGAAMLPPENDDLFVRDFDRHIVHAENFHRRWMGSNTHKNRWCERVAELPIDMLCPQHGSIYRGDDVGRFIEWFHDLEVGVA